MDSRFKTAGQDARFPSPGTDVRFPGGGVDARFLDGADTRFESETYGTAPGGGGIITASVAPSTQAVADGDTWADLLLASATNTANYSSTAGTISSAVAEVQVDGGAWTALSGNTTTALSASEDVATRVTVTDSAANERVFLGGAVTVSAGASAHTFDSTNETFDLTTATFDEAA